MGLGGLGGTAVNRVKYYWRRHCFARSVARNECARRVEIQYGECQL